MYTNIHFRSVLVSISIIRKISILVSFISVYHKNKKLPKGSICNLQSARRPVLQREGRGGSLYRNATAVSNKVA